ALLYAASLRGRGSKVVLRFNLPPARVESSAAPGALGSRLDAPEAPQARAAGRTGGGYTAAPMLDQLDTLEREGLAQLNDATDPAGLEAWRVAFLGSNGRVKAVMALLKDVPKDQKPAAGKRSNEVKQKLEAAFQERQSAIGPAARGPTGPAIDVTEPGFAPPVGRSHIITRVRAELCDVFGRMGFEVATGPELEDDEHNFVKPNIPDSHPAGEPIDNFYIQERGDTSRPRMLRSQTSTVQIRVMERAVREGWGPPLKIVAPGRVYRP